MNFLLKYNIYKSFYIENSEILYLNSSFCFKNSFQAEKYFKNSLFYNIYSRFKNPTLNNLENKILFLENSNFCLVVSSGMAAIICIFFVFLKSNDNFISSKNLFSPTLIFFVNILFKFNIFVKFISILNTNNYIKVFNNFNLSKLVFFESPSNPTLEILDIYLISYFSKKFNKLLIIDNTFSTPIIQNPLIFNVDIIIHSCTKFLDGQSRVLGGAILSNNKNIIKKIFIFIKIFGFTLSVFNSWLIIKSIETLFIRIKFQNRNSFFFIKFLKSNIYIYNLFYPGYNFFYKRLVFLQQILNNSLIAFNLKSFCIEIQRVNVWKFLNYLNLISITANLGDIKTIITHPTTTTHNGINFIEKFIYNIPESLIRLSIGVEDINDILYDFYLSLKKI